MPAAWIGAGAAVYGAINSGGGGGSGGGGQQMYQPTGLGYADQNWQNNQQTNQNQLNYGAPVMQPNYWGPPQGGSGWGGQPQMPQGGGGYGGGGGRETWQQGMGQGQQQPQQQGAPSGTIGGNSQNYGYTGMQGGGMQGGTGGQIGAGATGGGGGAGGGFGGYGSTGGVDQSGQGGGPQQQAPGGGGGGGGGGYGGGAPGGYGPGATGGGLAGTVDPALYQSFQQSQNINYAPYLGASQQAGQQYGQLAGAANQVGQGMMNEGQYAFGQQQQLGRGGQQVMNTAFDPQQQLYDRTKQQVQDQSNSVASQFGLGSSAAGAGLTDQALSNFNIDWQDKQLGRQTQGLGAYDAAAKAGGQLGTLGNASLQGGLDTYSQMPGFTQQSAGVPLTAQQMVAGMPAQNASQYAQGIQGAMSPYMAQQGQAIPYMNYGAGAQNYAQQNQLRQNQFQADQQGQLSKSIGQVPWGQLSSMWNQPQPTQGYVPTSQDLAGQYSNTAYTGLP